MQAEVDEVHLSNHQLHEACHSQFQMVYVVDKLLALDFKADMM